MDESLKTDQSMEDELCFRADQPSEMEDDQVKDSKKNQSLDAQIRSMYQLGEVDVRTYSPLTLAYIGDAVYELIIRSVVVGHGNTAPRKLHTRTSKIVNAHAQAQMMDILEPLLTDTEADVFRRGRNAKSGTTAKNQTIADYRRATGFEALIGYLYLTDQADRVMELVHTGISNTFRDEQASERPEK